jgi:hypothetical protein
VVTLRLDGLVVGPAGIADLGAHVQQVLDAGLTEGGCGEFGDVGVRPGRAVQDHQQTKNLVGALLMWLSMTV